MGKHDQIFHANKELSNILIDIWCFDAWLLLFVSFAYLFSYSKRLDLTGNFLSLHHLYSLFKTCQTLWPLKNILFQSFTLFCQTLELRLPQDDTNQFKTKLNEHVRWKKFPFDNCTSLNTLMNFGEWIIQHLQLEIFVWAMQFITHFYLSYYKACLIHPDRSWYNGKNNYLIMMAYGNIQKVAIQFSLSSIHWKLI